MMEVERLELRARVLDELIEQHGTLDIDQLKEFAEVSQQLKPYRCPGCYKIVYATNDHVMRHGVRTHRLCNEKIEREAKQARERLEEQKRRVKQINYEVEHNLRPISKTIAITVRGLQRDIENFDKSLDQIVKDHNLEPWVRVS